MSGADCDRERNLEHPSWWICHRCGSLWTEERMGADWLPLSCLARAALAKADPTTED